ncbi:MAG: hypothetical protein NVS2B4_11980 [Ramlibacter sp.]
MGFHHHATLSIAAYGFLVAERLRSDSDSIKKKDVAREAPALPEDYVARGSPAHAAPRAGLDHDAAHSSDLPPDAQHGRVSLLQT